MIERLTTAPLPFWFHLIILAVLVVEGFRRWNLPWAKPALVVYGTILFWYTGDFLLSDPLEYDAFSPDVVSMAFYQICLFLVCFRLMLVTLARRFCEHPLRLRRHYTSVDGRFFKREFSPRILRKLLIFLIIAWIGIYGMGIALSPHHWAAMIWPPLHFEKISMYPLAGVGGGISFIFHSLGYLHVLICALFGVVAAMARGPVRWIAIGMVLLTWPYFWFDRARNKMLALLLPGFTAFLLLGKGKLSVRVTVAVCLAVVIGGWFTRVAQYRSQLEMSSFLEASSTEGADEDEGSERKSVRDGQDMLKELCWINTLIESGRYRPTMGGRYFAELVNPIPRSLWPGKPMVGIDYAIARGFGGSRGAAGVFASISTGMIGQGCVNFGRFFGVISSAFLFALWAAFLARLWCQSFSPLRLALFLIGLGLTLNTGRDLTLLVLFPFLFGYLGILLYEQMTRNKPGQAEPRPRENSAKFKSPN
jgi:hypothetical protein